jgi:hypothetical protein
VSEHFKEQLSAITEVVDAVLLLTTFAPGGVLTEAEKSEHESALRPPKRGSIKMF